MKRKSPAKGFERRRNFSFHRDVLVVRISDHDQRLFATWGSTTRPIRQQNDKKHLSQWPLDRVRKANEPKWDRRRSKFLSLQCADLYVVEGRHEVCGDLSRLLFRYGVWRILFTSLKDVFQRTAIFGRASVSKQLNSHGWNRQQESDQDTSEATRKAFNLDGFSRQNVDFMLSIASIIAV